jgi:hypothetical protein
LAHRGLDGGSGCPTTARLLLALNAPAHGAPDPAAQRYAAWNTQHPELRELEGAMVRVRSQEIEQMAECCRDGYGSSGS